MPISVNLVTKQRQEWAKRVCVCVCVKIGRCACLSFQMPPLPFSTAQFPKRPPKCIALRDSFAPGIPLGSADRVTGKRLEGGKSMRLGHLFSQLPPIGSLQAGCFP